MSAKLIAALSAITLAVVAWFTLLGGSGSPSGDFATVHSSYQQAAVAITHNGDSVHSSPDLRAFNATCDQSLATMTAQIQAFQRIAKNESEEAHTIASDARATAQRGWDAARAYCTALSQTRLTDARHARGQLDAAMGDLSRQAESWKHR